MKRIYAVITGLVQGVFFRDCTCSEAERLGLSGWVRNRVDGSVEVELQGDKAEVKRMLSWLHTGSPMSRVQGVASKECPLSAQEDTFVVRY